MGTYFLKLAILLPLICGLAWACLLLWKRAQAGLLTAPGDDRALRVVEVLPMGPQTRLLLIDCGGRRRLIAQSRGDIVDLGEAA